MIIISVPQFLQVEDEKGDKFTAFEIHILKPGGQKIIEKRYKQFDELDEKIRRILPFAPKLPPKRVLNKSNKFLEHRREKLELYLQELIEKYLEVAHQLLTEFLETTLPVCLSARASSADELDAEDEVSARKTTHQRVVCFTHDPFISQASRFGESSHFKSLLPDVVVEGVCLGLYGECTPCSQTESETEEPND